MATSHAIFNKEASKKYKLLSSEERDELQKEVDRVGEQRMSKKAVKKRAQRISKRIQALVRLICVTYLRTHCILKFWVLH